MATAILQSPIKTAAGKTQWTTVSKDITHNNSRLYHERGRTFEYIGLDRAGNRIYRDAKPR